MGLDPSLFRSASPAKVANAIRPLQNRQTTRNRITSLHADKEISRRFSSCFSAIPLRSEMPSLTRHYPVNRRVNSVQNDDAECAAPHT